MKMASMTAEELVSLPAEKIGALQPLLLALWHDAQGDWARAHEVAQDVESSNGAWVHAYLHRKEGDAFNAAYWYRRAGKPVFAGTLGYLAGSGLAAWLGARIFRGDGGAAESVLIPVMLPVVVVLALVVAIAGSTPSIRAALRMEPSAILREDG